MIHPEMFSYSVASYVIYCPIQLNLIHRQFYNCCSNFAFWGGSTSYRFEHKFDSRQLYHRLVTKFCLVSGVRFHKPLRQWILEKEID